MGPGACSAQDPCRDVRPAILAPRGWRFYLVDQGNEFEVGQYGAPYTGRVA